MPAAPEPVRANNHRLEAVGMQKSFGARKVVHDVHLAVDSGEVVGLLGPNGAARPPAST